MKTIALIDEEILFCGCLFFLNKHPQKRLEQKAGIAPKKKPLHKFLTF